MAVLANLTPHSPAAVDTAEPGRGPLLLVAAGQDHTVPAVVTRAAYSLYEASPAVTELLEFPDRGHSITLDHGWEEVADGVLSWLAAKDLEPEPAPREG